MIYLASPYSHPDPFMREERYVRAMKVLSEQYLSKRRWAYSPIVHCHELAKIANLPKDADFWGTYNYVMMTKCDELHVLRLDGWEKSVGVNLEIQWAQTTICIPVSYI